MTSPPHTVLVHPLPVLPLPLPLPYPLPLCLPLPLPLRLPLDALAAAISMTAFFTGVLVSTSARKALRFEAVFLWMAADGRDIMSSGAIWSYS